jgi:hypothetical protein
MPHQVVSTDTSPQRFLTGKDLLEAMFFVNVHGRDLLQFTSGPVPADLSTTNKRLHTFSPAVHRPRTFQATDNVLRGRRKLLRWRNKQ